MQETLENQRLQFVEKSGKFLAFPIAGTIVWLVVGLASLFLNSQVEIYTVLFGTGAIFPLALLIAKFTGQDVFMKGNTFGALMGSSVLMVNLLWALHLIVVSRVPELAVLSIAIGLGIHWIVFGWIIQAPLGNTHAILRTFLTAAAFLLVPGFRVLAISLAVVICYLITIFQLLSFFKKQNS